MKPNWAKTEIQAFLKHKYHAEPTLFPIREGQESQVYGFKQGGASYILRIHPSKEGFLKDRYAYAYFGALVPIPEILEIGRFQESYFYCISRKAGGITYEDGDAQTVTALLPAVTKTWLALTKMNISGTSGFGVFESETGNAPFTSWRAFLLDVLDEEKYGWQKQKHAPSVDGVLLDALLHVYRVLIDYCPEERKLFHGDFGSNNLLVEPGRVTGVIDWDCASYGDPLYDIATAYFWRTWLLCMEKTWAYWKAAFCSLPEFHARVTCYALRIGLLELRENVAENDAEMTAWLQNRCREILKNK